MIEPDQVAGPPVRRAGRQPSPPVFGAERAVHQQDLVRRDDSSQTDARVLALEEETACQFSHSTSAAKEMEPIAPLERQGEVEDRPLAQLALDPDLAAMGTDGQAAEGQAQPQTLRPAFVMHPRESLKDALLVMRRNAWSGVAHADQDLPVGLAR